jgi:ABC-type dipeptide/oligopeptide/nickel transport system ATPase subunit
MARKGATPEKTIGLLRQAEVELAQGRTLGEIWRGGCGQTTCCRC